MTRPEEVAVARLLGPHGVCGEVEAKLITDCPDRIVAGCRFRLSPPVGGMAEVEVERVRTKKHVLLLTLTGVEDRDAATSLRGSHLMIPASELPRLEQGTYYHHELLGMRVVTVDGRELGEIADIIVTGANDVYVVRGADGEVLVPAVKSVVTDVDVDGGVMMINPIHGMIDGDGDED